MKLKIALPRCARTLRQISAVVFVTLSLVISCACSNAAGNAAPGENGPEAVTHPPAISSSNGATFTVAVAGNFTITATGTPTPSLTETGVLPSGVAFVDNGNGTATLSGTRLTATAGSYAITITATNGVGTSAIQSFTLIVGSGGSGSSNFAYVGGSATGIVDFGGDSGTTLSVALHQSPGAGHFLICAATWHSSNTTASMSDPNNGTWRPIGSPKTGVGGLNNYRGQMFYVPAAVNAPTTVTLTISATVTFRSFECAEYSYSGTIASLDGTPQYSTTPASGGVATINGLATSNSSDLVFADCLGVDSNCTVGSGYTGLDDTNSVFKDKGLTGQSFRAGTGQLMEYKVGAAAGAQSATFVTGTNTDNVILGLVAATASGTGQTQIAPAITSASSAAFSVGVAGSFTVTATGTPTPTLTETGARPSGVTFVNNGNGTATLSGTPASGTAGSYPLTITASNGVGAAATQNFTLTVTGGAAQTITFGALGNVTYGVAPITLTATASSGLPVSYAVTSGPATVSGTTLKVTGAGTVTVTATQAGNGAYAAATSVSRTFTSSRATLTVRANNLSRQFGQANPPLTYGITGFVNGDTQSVVSGTPILATAANTGSAVGSYQITITAGTLSATNYAFTLVGGTLTVTGGAAAQTITFGTLGNVTYGVAPITLMATASSGLAVSYAVTSGPATVSGTTLRVTGAGSVTVTATQTGNSSYLPAVPVAQTFTSSRATLTVTANNLSRQSGQANPALTYTITGFVNGDTQSVVSGTPTLTTTANSSSPIGTYPITITAGTLSAANYTFTFVNGTLTVTSSTGRTYTTSFASPPAPENPICENTGSGCNWIGGSTAGGSRWGNVQTVSGKAFGVSEPTQFGDPTAILTGTWGPNQTVTAVAKIAVNHTGSCCHELELRLRMTISANSITGYEAYCSEMPDNRYCSIARWNGANGSYVNLAGENNTYVRNGDVMMATVTGTNPTSISLYMNGTLVLTATDTGAAGNGFGAFGPFTSGNPGIGFYDQQDGAWSDFGFSSFSATDSNTSNLQSSMVTTGIARLVATAPVSQTLRVATATTVGLSSPSLAFGSVYVGDTSTAPLTLTNTGSAALNVSSVEVTGANAGDFVETNKCGGIAPGGTCTINVAFTPSSTKSEAATLTITDNVAGSPQTVTLTGTGMISAGQFMALSADKTHLVNTFTGKPVYITGEQAYSLATNLSGSADVELYLSTRQSMGFNLISVAAADIAHLVNYPDNALGQPPFNGAAFTNLNEAYWEHLDDVIQRAAAHGFTVLLNVAFVGSGPSGCSEANGWCPDLLSDSDATLTAYGVSIGNRYKSYPNIVWMLGGDNDLADYPAMKSKIQDIANGIASVDSVHLMTIENECPYCASQDDWAGGPSNINLLLHGASGMASEANANYVRGDDLPILAVADTQEGEGSAPSDIGARAENYQAVLGGANLGSVFGDCVVSYFGTKSQNCSAWSSNTQWRTWFNTTGAMGTTYLGNLMRSREFWKMVPDINRRVGTAGFGSGDAVTATSRTSDGQTIIAYIPNGNALTVDMSQITSTGRTADCWWFNPGNGASKMIGTYGNSGTQNFTPPDSSDWVLVIDDASASLPAPGTTN
jgi:hypothetical protein